MDANSRPAMALVNTGKSAAPVSRFRGYGVQVQKPVLHP
jgi:hypothetical protein